MLARRKSHHTALVDAAAPISECQASVVRNSESPNEPRCTTSPMSPLARQEMRSSPALQQQPLAASAYHSYTSRVGLRSTKCVFCPWCDCDLEL